MIDLFLDREYCTIDLAKNANAFSHIKSGVYLWYYPIRTKPKLKKTNESLKSFYEVANDETKITPYIDYCMQNEISLNDKTKGYKSIILSSSKSCPKYLQIDDNELDSFPTSSKFGDVFQALSVFNKPLYIGKSSPAHTDSSRDLSNRIKEHLSSRSDFGRAIRQNSSRIQMEDYIVRGIDIGKIDDVFFEGKFRESNQLAEFIEAHLINLFKPNFNIKY